MLSDRLKWILVHSTRTAVVAVASLLVARFFGLPEAYWAPITTLVITQSSLGAALFVSWQRFVGTVVGALMGATAASYFGPHVLVFGICVFILGLLRAVTWSDLTAYRFGSVDAGGGAAGAPDGSCTANRFSSVRRSVHRHWGSANLGYRVAGERSHTL